jgi:hypothetical protein
MGKEATEGRLGSRLVFVWPLALGNGPGWHSALPVTRNPVARSAGEYTYSPSDGRPNPASIAQVVVRVSTCIAFRGRVSDDMPVYCGMSAAALERFVCAAIILVCANAVVRAQEPSQSDNYTASMLQICRLYTNATAQTGMPADLLFQQCMAERHCRISPRSTAYQCEPPGPMIITPGA